MRIGSNPHKVQKKIALENNHRVVVVVFIPQLTGYYQKSLDVFKLCIESLVRTNTGEYSITVVNNGSCREVKDLLDAYSSKEVDTIIHHARNIGKIDALVGAARGVREELITLSDADILYKKNWDKATREVFRTFKKAGSVSPISFRHGLFYGTSSVLREVLFGRLEFSYEPIPENFEDQNKYLSSINWNNEKDDQVEWPVVSLKGVKAVIGSGHQVLTLKREILFSSVPEAPSLTLVGGNSENKYIDEPIDKAGFMRLSTYNNYAYHMGNEIESWMEKIPSGEKEDFAGYHPFPLEKKKVKTSGHRAFIIRKHLVKRLFKFFYHQ
ncbi:glycosyltransferase family A protein [Salinimicrobium terrae]|uniref:glycosyltransferase family A protein n=1 Tax=Salinimicrobium terrae TaxID=470866 RepID=UPI0003F710F4|nr:glycosyltransferase family 2 protein [Salinimicrobium terrae]